MKQIAVVCGSVREFQTFCRQHNLVYRRQTESVSESGQELFIYISSPRVLRGSRIEDYRLYGLWYERSDIDEIKDEIEIRLGRRIKF